MAKKPASMSPTKRTLAWLRKMGYTVGITEHWNSFVKRRQDLFGCIDLIAISSRPGHVRGCLGIQATTGSNAAARLTKIASIPAAKTWIEAGNKLWIVAWRKLKTTNKWEPNVIDVLIGDFGSLPSGPPV